MPTTTMPIKPGPILRTGALVVGILTGATKVCLLVSEAIAHTDIVNTDVNDIISITAIVSWIGYFGAHCRDQVLTYLDNRLNALTEAIGDYGDQRAIDAQTDTMRALHRAGGINGNSGVAYRQRGGHISPVE